MSCRPMFGARLHRGEGEGEGLIGKCAATAKKRFGCLRLCRFPPNVHSGGITIDGNANAYEYFSQIWRKVHKSCTFPNNIAQRTVKTSETT